jgi:predicted acyltransferase
MICNVLFCSSSRCCCQTRNAWTTTFEVWCSTKSTFMFSFCLTSVGNIQAGNWLFPINVLHVLYLKCGIDYSFGFSDLLIIACRFIYETEHHNGIAELLEILGR